MTRIYLGGGGSEHDEALLWDEVFIPGQRVAIWPFAMVPGAPRTASVRWLSGALRARGDFTIDAWGFEEADGDGDHDVQRLQRSDVLAIPGGNTFDLLDHLRRHHLLDALEVFLDAGGRVYGGSAGAIVLGADIAIAEAEDANDAGLVDTRALDRLGGAVVRPHYQPSHDGELQQWAREHQQVVLALPERSGVAVEHASARNLGPDPVRVFTPTGEHTHPAGARWDIARP